MSSMSQWLPIPLEKSFLHIPTTCSKYRRSSLWEVAASARESAILVCLSLALQMGNAVTFQIIAVSTIAQNCGDPQALKLSNNSFQEEAHVLYSLF